MTRDQLQQWLDEYVEAWKSYDPERIGALFAEGAEYRYHPFDDEPARGRDAIVASWTGEENRDPPGTYDARYTPFAIDGQTAVATGASRYYTDETRTTLEREYHNAYLMAFDVEGRCTSFKEYYMRTPLTDGVTDGGLKSD